MPWVMRWEDPEVFLEHNGVTVYHCYSEDGVVASDWFTTDPGDDDIDNPLDTGGQFDFTDLPSVEAPKPYHTWGYRKAVIENAIRLGLLTKEGLCVSASDD